MLEKMTVEELNTIKKCATENLEMFAKTLPQGSKQLNDVVEVSIKLFKDIDAELARRAA